MREHLNLAALLSALAVCSCTQAGGGKLAATSTGDLSFALRDRGAPTSYLQERCGTRDATLASESGLLRAPYLQRLGATSALVLFSAEPSLQSHTVTLTEPSGEVVAEVVPKLDASAPGGQQWIAALSGLEPNTVYCYAVGDPATRIGFRTAPLPGAEAPVRFLVYGDSGNGDAMQEAVAEQMHTVAFDFMLHTGDIVYGGGRGGTAAYDSEFFSVYEELLESVPVFPTSGNHDYDNAGAASFRQVFALHENGGTDGFERWYSFDWGDIHFVALDTEQIGEAQKAWLERDLAASELPWKVVYLHRPPFSSGSHGSTRAVREAFLPTFEAHGVQVVFAGHDHNYERTQTINGVTYVVTGGGGHGTRSVGHSSFTAFSEDVLHFVQAEVQGDTMVLHAIDATGTEFDSVRIPRVPAPAEDTVVVR